MKKIITLTVITFIISMSVQAQSAYDAGKIASSDLTGTARFVGMGGAMGALGGDISTIGTNPAGIGIFRSNDIMTTFNFSTLDTKGKYQGNSFSQSVDRFSFNNVGVVLSTHVGNNTSLRYVNFAFNYSRSKSFYKNMSMAGVLNANPNNQRISPTYYMAKQANSNSENLEVSTAFRNPNVGWLSALAAQTSVIYLEDYEDGSEYVTGLGNGDSYVDFFRGESGGIGRYDFNASFNIDDRFYIGATIGAYDVDYRKYSSYDEDYGDGQGYNLQSWNRIDGTGVDFKLGAILRPFDDSSFRIGLAVHTPVFYKLTLGTSARMESDFYYDGNSYTTYTYSDTYDILRGDYRREFDLRTPWKLNTSLGYTIGKNIALGFEYEFEDYSTMKMQDVDGYNMTFENNTIKQVLKSVNTFRLGVEYKPISEFALRAGYNYSTAAYKNDGFKNIPANSINTDMDYANIKGISNYTLGVGYRGDIFYADVAYKYNNYNENFFAFYDANNQGDVNFLKPTKTTNNQHQVFLTLGVRF